MPPMDPKAEAARPLAPGHGRRARSARGRMHWSAASLGLDGWLGLEVFSAALGLAVVWALSRRVDLLWTAAPVWVTASALVVIALAARRVPVDVACLWLLGLASYAWSLAPGDTLLAAIWTLVFVAAAVAGRWRAGFVLTAAVIVVYGLQDALTLNAFHLQQYLSGSVHYRLGQVALVLVPVAVAGYSRTSRKWLALSWWSVAFLSAFAALMSGSRGVYVPLVVIFAVSFWRLARTAALGPRLIVGTGSLLAAIVLTDAAIPFHPVREALTSKASLHAQEVAVRHSGSFTDRLRFWDQGLHMALSRPLGVGLGAFRSTVHAFQRFPMLWSSSPHNVFVETVATTGWLGLALLVLVLVRAFWQGWTSTRWPWALALAGIWFALSADVTADYPSIMVIAFGTVGACLGSGNGSGVTSDAIGSIRRPDRRLGTVIPAMVVVAGIALSIWWFLPCSGTECVLSRWRGVEYKAVAAVRQMPDDARPAFFARLERLYPRSLWVLQLEEAYAPPSGKLLAARRIALAYPLESWQNYLVWANLSIQAGDVREAKRAALAGLRVFGPGSRRFPEMRADPAGYRAWLARAQEILAMKP